MSSRSEQLAARLQKGIDKALEILSRLEAEKWQQPIYKEPKWDVRALVAHFLSAERHLLTLGKDIAGGGHGAPADIDIHHFNALEQIRLTDVSPGELLELLANARRETIGWILTLDDSQLDLVGRHPALGKVNLETMVISMYGHQLLHMRDLQKRLTDIV